MGLRVGVLVGLGVLVTVLQTSFIPFFQVAEVKPDLLLVLCLVLGLTFGPREAGWMGAGLGMAADLLSGRQIGFFTASLAFVSYIMALLGQKVYREHLVVPVLAGFAGTWLLHGVEAGMRLLGGLEGTWHVAALVTLLEAGANAVLTGLFHGPARRLEAFLAHRGRHLGARRPDAWA